jgi:hypothetical protein
MTEQELANRMAVLLGGRAAEFIFFGHLSTGAADDFVKATDTARSMVLRYGMDKKLGHVAYECERPAMLGAPAPQVREFSDETERLMDHVSLGVRHLAHVLGRLFQPVERNKKNVLARCGDLASITHGSLLWLRGSAQSPRMNPCPLARPGEREQEENR